MQDFSQQIKEEQESDLPRLEDALSVKPSVILCPEQLTKIEDLTNTSPRLLSDVGGCRLNLT
jgi:hypothetical protein